MLVIGECLNIFSEFGGPESISSVENCLIGWDNSYFNISTFCLILFASHSTMSYGNLSLWWWEICKVLIVNEI